LLIASCSNTIILLLLCSRLRRSATKEPSDCVADRRADCYTSVSSSSV
jgi:hypothetical protein